jgi:uncharacterized membrane protein YcaP (DUF421 family)
LSTDKAKIGPMPIPIIGQSLTTTLQQHITTQHNTTRTLQQHKNITTRQQHNTRTLQQVNNTTRTLQQQPRQQHIKNSKNITTPTQHHH